MNTYTLYTDGSHMPYTKMSGIGGYLLDDKNNQVFEFSEIVSEGKNLNQFEIHAMEYGLKKALEHGVKNLKCFSDYKFLCEISNLKDPTIFNHYNDTNPELSQIFPLLLQFENIEFTYVPRKLNSRADTLSRKAILDVVPTGNIPLENSFQIPNLVFSEKLSPDNKKVFATYKKKYTDFYFFDMQQEKNEDASGFVYSVKAYYSKKTSHGLENILLSEKSLSFKTIKTEMLNFINETLSHSQLDTLGLIIYGKNSNSVKEILKGIVPVSEKLKKTLFQLEQTLSQFSEIIFYDDSAIINYFYPNTLNDVEKKSLTKEEIILAMKSLGQDNYKLGQNPGIENYYDLPDNKKNVIPEIQKKYLTEFLKIAFREDSLFHEYAQTPAEKTSLYTNDTMTKIQKIRENLEQEGIKFRI